MQVIWEGEVEETIAAAFRLVMISEGSIMFQRRSADQPEWSDVDDAIGGLTPEDSLFAV